MSKCPKRWETGDPRMWQPHWPGDPHHSLKDVPFFLPSSRPWVWGCRRSILHLLPEWMIVREVKYIYFERMDVLHPHFQTLFENNFPGLQFIFRLIRRRVSWVIERANAKSGGICVCHSCYRHSVGGPRIQINILQCTGEKWSVSCSVVSDSLPPHGL